MFLILEEYAPTLVPYSIDEGYRVSKLVNNAKHDSPDCLKPG